MSFNPPDEPPSPAARESNHCEGTPGEHRTALLASQRPQCVGAALLADMSGAPPGELAAVLGEGAAQPEPVAGEAIPALFCPGPARRDDALGDEVNERLVEWAARVGIYPGRLDRLRACRLGQFITLCHPGTDDPDRLLAAAQCLGAAFSVDDYYGDEMALGADPQVLGSRVALLYSVADPSPPPRRYAPERAAYLRAEPIASAHSHALEYLGRYASAAQLGRYRHKMATALLGDVLEASWALTGDTPSVWAYLAQRHLNSFQLPMVLIDVLAGYELPPEEFYQLRVCELITLAGGANTLLNDLCSAGVESGTLFDLPRVLTAREGCTPREAIKRTVEIHNELMRMFVTEATALSATGSPTLRRFLADAWSWMGGCREWHVITNRYQLRTA